MVFELLLVYQYKVFDWDFDGDHVFFEEERFQNIDMSRLKDLLAFAGFQNPT